MRVGWVIGASLLALSGMVVQASAAERLTTEGVQLPAMSFAPGGALEARVDVGGDEVLSAHALLRPASSNMIWMRDRDGFWSDWSGDRDALAPSAARREGDDLVFKIFDAPPPSVSAMTITVIYRTTEGLKFGWFEAAERAE